MRASGLPRDRGPDTGLPQPPARPHLARPSGGGPWARKARARAADAGPRSAGLPGRALRPRGLHAVQRQLVRRPPHARLLDPLPAARSAARRARRRSGRRRRIGRAVRSHRAPAFRRERPLGLMVLRRRHGRRSAHRAGDVRDGRGARPRGDPGAAARPSLRRPRPRARLHPREPRRRAVPRPRRPGALAGDPQADRPVGGRRARSSRRPRSHCSSPRAEASPTQPARWRRSSCAVGSCSACCPVASACCAAACCCTSRAAALAFAIATPMGGNASRLGVAFAGPLLLCAVLASGDP